SIASDRPMRRAASALPLGRIAAVAFQAIDFLTILHSATSDPALICKAPIRFSLTYRSGRSRTQGLSRSCKSAEPAAPPSSFGRRSDFRVCYADYGRGHPWRPGFAKVTPANLLACVSTDPLTTPSLIATGLGLQEEKRLPQADPPFFLLIARKGAAGLSYRNTGKKDHSNALHPREIHRHRLGRHSARSRKDPENPHQQNRKLEGSRKRRTPRPHDLEHRHRVREHPRLRLAEGKPESWRPRDDRGRAVRGQL